MTTLVEGRHDGEYIVSEPNGHRGRETETLAAGNDLQAGTVLGKITSGNTATATAGSSNTGDGTIDAITAAGAEVGAYTLTFIEPEADAGTFEVQDPQGRQVGTGVVGQEFTGGGLTFTVSDGPTDFVAGDQFVIDVDAGSGQVTALDLSAEDGSNVASGILFNTVDSGASPTRVAVTARDTEVNGAELIWPAGITAQQKSAALSQLADLGIVVR